MEIKRKKERKKARKQETTMKKHQNEEPLQSNNIKINYSIITEIIDNDSKVLDLGCGDGELLHKLIQEKKIKGLGIEINQDSAVSALEKGLSIIQGDLDEGLSGIQDKEYDWAILNQTLQSTEKPDYVIKEMLRVSKKAIVSFPNFAYWKIRFHLFFKGRMPKSDILPFEWYDTPNIHLLTINDFYEFCKKYDIKILQSIHLTKSNVKRNPIKTILSSFFTEEVIFVISK